MNRETEFRGKRLTVRESAKQRKPLDGTDAQALEGALQQVERELAEAVKVLRMALNYLPAKDGQRIPGDPDSDVQLMICNKIKSVLAIHDTEEQAE